MQPHGTETVVKALIMLQMVTSVTLVAATFAAVVVEVPLYLAMLLLGGVGLMLLITNRQHRDPGVLLFGGLALVFAYPALHRLKKGAWSRAVGSTALTASTGAITGSPPRDARCCRSAGSRGSSLCRRLPG